MIRIFSEKETFPTLFPVGINTGVKNKRRTNDSYNSCGAALASRKLIHHTSRCGLGPIFWMKSRYRVMITCSSRCYFLYWYWARESVIRAITKYRKNISKIYITLSYTGSEDCLRCAKSGISCMFTLYQLEQRLHRRSKYSTISSAEILHISKT